jgi:hypothetical protein
MHIAPSLSGSGALLDGAARSATTRVSTRKAIGAALGQVVRSTASRLRPARGVRSAVLAPPEEREDDDGGGGEAESVGGASSSSASSSSMAAQITSASSGPDLVLSPASLRPPHLRGYATVPHGFTPVVTVRQRPAAPAQVSTGNGFVAPIELDAAAHAAVTTISTSSGLVSEGDRSAGTESMESGHARNEGKGSEHRPAASAASAAVEQPRTPPRPRQAAAAASVAAALSSLTPSALFSRVSAFALRHRGGPSPSEDVPGARVAPGAASTPASRGSDRPRGAGSLLVVPMGGEFADTEPTFVQVDGEGYKVFALRRLELAFCARALMVTFK